MKQFPILETKRLQLVQIDHQYDQSYFDIMSQVGVTKYYGIESLKNREEAAEIIDSFQTLFEKNQGLRWGIVLKETKEFIGTVGLNNLKLRDKKAEIGFDLHPAKWRQGYTTEAVKAVLTYAFEALDLFRMGAITYPANTASNQLLKKAGFTLEGKLRGYLYQNNQSHDALVYSLLQTEWKQPTREAVFEIEERLQYKDHMSEIIKKAEREGHFDDLPGKGKPLDLGQDYMNPAEKQLYKTMKDNHILPRWIELGNEIDGLKENLSTLDTKEKRKIIKEINKKTKEYNLACPPSLQRNRVSE